MPPSTSHPDDAPPRWALAAWKARGGWRGPPLALTHSLLTSTVLHAVLVILLGLWMFEQRPPSAAVRVVAAAAPVAPPVERLAPPVEVLPDLTPQEVVAAAPVPELAASGRGPSSGPPDVRLPWTLGLETTDKLDLLAKVQLGAASSLDGRSPYVRPKLLAEGGGSPQSEEAVARGLRWLQAHQRPDGSWHFNHHLGPCAGLCRDPGTSNLTTAATAMALLPFLAANHTSRRGDYQETVETGLYYLKKRMVMTPRGGDFRMNLHEGMYGQGLAVICLCEALAMTGDDSLRSYAQDAVNFLVYAQDAKGGGWRYDPGEPGDMTVTGWQIMALRSGQMVYLRIPPDTFSGAVRFLDSAGQDYGAFYGYLAGGKEPTCTAVGLLSRMYTGWRRDNGGLVRGVAYLSQLGPSKSDMYYNYYATQVMRHWGGGEWLAWNRQMRDYLVETQARAGHESGSWSFADSHHNSEKGGRLFNTCLAILTLEVYYRYLPLYGSRAVDDNF